MNGLASTEFPALGTTAVVGVTDPDVLADVAAYARARIDEVDRALSRFRDDSELAWIERQPGPYHLVSPLFAEVLDLAYRAAASTDGWYDPTVRDAVEAAGYDRSIELVERDGPGAARPVAPAGQWTRIAYGRAARLVLLPEGVRLDFGGIGKGFAVDYALRGAPSRGAGVLIGIGGDLGVVGDPPGDGWPCDVAVAADGEPATAVLLRRGGLATSGIGRRQWSRDGEALHHLIDPRVGRPGQSPWRIVTVAAPTCAQADVAAKVAWLRGDDGPPWIERRHLAARFQSLEGAIVLAGDWPAVRSAA